MKRTSRRIAISLLLAIVVVHCATRPRPGEPAPRAGDEIVVCGERFHIGTPVVLWTDPGGYDAYRVEPRFADAMDERARAEWKPEAHYDSMRRHVPLAEQARFRGDGMRVADLARYVDLFVVHYDVCGTSRRCFQVLQDERHLSVHFLLDVDGTIYQTLDLKERAWHASVANDRSIGIEIAQVGAYPRPDHEALRQWYARDEHGPFVVFDQERDALGIRTPNFVARPARPALLTGAIHGTPLWQYDFTSEQYEALAKLTAALHRILPRISLNAPRDAKGAILMRSLSPDEFATYSGVLGHFHITEAKSDPGPAFDWGRVLATAAKTASSGD
ncbi:MAG: N-acetylmuramoyl-L-alanine amidase [Planctomycetes bacterium]|nr:N-acetylmuramoyl-L-alanine amidase [Planctomycetota bacterium]